MANSKSTKKAAAQTSQKTPKKATADTSGMRRFEEAWRKHEGKSELAQQLQRKFG